MAPLSHQRAIECSTASLIDNALRAVSKHGANLVGVRSDGVVAVNDHGGVAAADREMIFEPRWNPR